MRQEEEKILSKDCSPAWQQRSPLTMKSSPWFLHLCQASTVSALDFEAGQAAANLRRRSPFGNQSQPGYRRHWCSTMLRIDISSLKHSSLSIPFTIHPSPSPFTSPPPPKHILRHFEARHQSEKKNYNNNSSCLVTVSQRHIFTILKLGINLKKIFPINRFLALDPRPRPEYFFVS